MKKNENNCLTHSVDAAYNYINGERAFCLGSDKKGYEVIKRIKLPPLPLLLNNKELRESLESRRKSPLFRIVAASIATKAKNLKEEIKAAQKINPIEYPVLYRLEPPMDGEKIYDALTEKEFQVYCQDEGETKM